MKNVKGLIGCIVVGIVTGVVSGMFGFKPTMWEHWIIFIIGMGSFTAGRFIGFDND